MNHFRVESRPSLWNTINFWADGDGHWRRGGGKGRGGDLDRPPGGESGPFAGSEAVHFVLEITVECGGDGDYIGVSPGKMRLPWCGTPQWTLAIRALFQPGCHTQSYLHGEFPKE